ncbi:MAG: endonuclease NucS domain-containing protein [Pyrinomonadaceae bacterium]
MKKKIFTTEDRQLLLQCEEIIRNDRRPEQRGEALATVQKMRLYMINHRTFDGWCSEVAMMSKQHAYRLIKAKPEFDRLKSGGINLGKERLIRSLLREPDAAQRTRVVEQAMSAGRGKTTVQDLEGVLESLQESSTASSQGLAESVVEFGLEKNLEEFIVANFESVFGGRLRIYQDPDTGAYGQQYQTAIGVIDILAVDAKTKSFVVIELKKGRSSDDVVGQILRYMGWVKEHLCKANQSVRGLIICKEPDPRLSSAIKMTQRIDVKYYSVSFKLLDGQ